MDGCIYYFYSSSYFPMTEEWRAVIGFENRYEVSNAGRVRSLRKGIILKPETHRKGHLKVDLCNGIVCKKLFIHRLVALAFIEQTIPERIVVNHKDGNKKNNVVENLEWLTMTENTQHYFREIYGIDMPEDVEF